MKSLTKNFRQAVKNPGLAGAVKHMFTQKYREKLAVDPIDVGGIVVDEQGNILLVKTIHGGWGFPGGQVEEGENLLDALSREIKEESGIDAVVSHLIGVIPAKVMLDYVCKPMGGELSTSEETSESR